MSKLRLLRLKGVVETKSRFLDLDRDFSIVKTSFLKLTRFSRLSRLTLCQCRDRESWSRPRRDKSRPPGLIMYEYFFQEHHHLNVNEWTNEWMNELLFFFRNITTPKTATLWSNANRCSPHPVISLSKIVQIWVQVISHNTAHSEINNLDYGLNKINKLEL